MPVAELHGNMNGVVRISKRGLVKFQFGDETDNEPVLTFDIVEVFDNYERVNWEFRDKDGVLPKEKWQEHSDALFQVLQSFVNDAYKKYAGDKTPYLLSRGEAEIFLSMIRKEVKMLRDFISPPKDEPTSPPANSEGTEVRFSQ